MTGALPLALSIALVSLPTPAAPDTADRLRPLHFLIGTWATADSFVAGQSSRVERGVRRCALTLQRTYIECVTTAPKRDGASREYRFYFTWDESRKEHTLLQFWSDYPGYSQSSLRPAADGRSWDVRNITPVVRDGIERRSWATITIDSPDRFVWRGRANTSDQPPDRWDFVFQEVSTRMP